MKTPLEILQEYWHVSSFRPPQEAIINAVVAKKHVVTVLPTGSGKSVCFQVPELMCDDGVCVVISPLIALMKDQVESLRNKGIKAIALSGHVSQQDISRHFDNLMFGGIRFLYLSPERLQSDFIQKKIKQLNVNLIAVDEAHCISEWGHDFRPSYLKIKVLKELQPQAPLIALTATATQQVLLDISKYLELDSPLFFKKSQRRSNLSLKVIESGDKLGRMLELLKTTTEPVIIYAASRKKCKEISDYINSQAYSATYYHAGLTKHEKDTAYKDWLSENKQIIVATNAFGMGIDKPNVRLVIHIALPSSLENYVQEVGRAGRDGKKSFGVIIEEPGDFKRMETYYAKALPDVDFVKLVYNNLNQYFSITYGDLPQQHFHFDISAFCYHYNLPIVKTYNALQILEREEVLEQTNHNKQVNQLFFKTKGKRLFDYYDKNPRKASILKTILRSYEGLFEAYQMVNLYKLSQKLGLSKAELIRQLEESDKDGVLIFQKNKSSDSIRFCKPREDASTINLIARRITQQYELKLSKYRSILSYVQNTSMCRNVLIDKYFGETEIEDCGVCDVCLSKQEKKNYYSNEIEGMLIDILKTEDCSSRELVQRLKIDDKRVLEALRNLLDTHSIVLTSQNKYRLK